MSQPRLNERAEADLEDIWVHIAKDNPTNAARFVSRILQTCQRLAETPGMGRPRPELGAHLRSFVVGSYLIFYRPIEEGIEVVRVLHGRRDWRGLLRQGD